MEQFKIILNMIQEIAIQLVIAISTLYFLYLFVKELFKKYKQD